MISALQFIDYFSFVSMSVRQVLFIKLNKSFWLSKCYLQTEFEQKLSQSFYISFILLTLSAPCISESCIKIKINLNFYFHTSLCCLKRFYEDIKGLHKTFSGTAKKSENKNLSWFFSPRPGLGRKGLIIFLQKEKNSLVPGFI